MLLLQPGFALTIPHLLFFTKTIFFFHCFVLYCISVLEMSIATETNTTQLEKHSAVRFDCTRAKYKAVSLYDFIYKHECFPGQWRGFFAADVVKKEIAENLSPKLQQDAKIQSIEPPMPLMFNAFQMSPKDVKVVILGQDPTPQPNQATGMAFSLKPGVEPSTVPSVLNILVELKWEGVNVDLSNGDLTPWRDQGVLLLNAALTVMQGQAGSHQRLWARFAKLLIQFLDKSILSSAWILWGGQAQKFGGLIETRKHYIKIGFHPSPRSQIKEAGFFGGNYFRCANEFLRSKQRSEVDWRLPKKPLSVAAKRATC